MFIDPKDPAMRRGLINELVAPRPIAWVSTLDPDGVANLAPFSHFNVASSAPAVLMFSCNTPEDRSEKDTLANIRATGEFVVNVVGHAWREQMVQTSAQVERDVDEFTIAGLQKADSGTVSVPRVAGIPAAFECRLRQIVTIAAENDRESDSNVVFGSVSGIHVDDDYLDAEGRFDTAAARLIARLGGRRYVASDDLFELVPQFTPRS